MYIYIYTEVFRMSHRRVVRHILLTKLNSDDVKTTAKSIESV